jgi:nuclear pore complex protein Nup98-Nup96
VTRQRESYEQSVWELASILFDPVEARSAAMMERLRRDMLAKLWGRLVQETSSKAVERATTYEEKAIHLLAQRKITEACRVLLDGKNPKVATLVSLIGSSDSFKKDMREQMEEWHQGDVLSEFALPLRVIYSLLGGNVTVVRGKKGVGVENRMDSEIISQRFGLDWKQAFGLRLWYGVAAEDGIAAAVEQFMEDVEQGRVPAPRPWYVEQGIEVAWEDSQRERREDLLWGLLKVFAGRSTLEDILQPENSQLSPFNFRLCWQLAQSIAAVGDSFSLSDEAADALTMSYATEVVYHGQPGNWIAAIWILCHLLGQTTRAKAIQEVLDHHAGELFTAQAKEHNFYERLTDELKVPAPWIWKAAALHWRGKQNHPEIEAQCLLRADAFADAHEIFVRDLAPRAVIEANHTEMEAMLRKLHPHRHHIPTWTTGGQVYAHYLELLAARKKGGLVPSKLIESLVSALPELYEKAGTVDVRIVAAVTEMADVVAREALVLAGKGRVSQPHDACDVWVLV